MSEIQSNEKLITVGYLAKVLTPVVTVIKSAETAVMNTISVPKGGATGQVLIKSSDADGEIQWADASTQIEENLKAYIDEAMQEYSEIDDGEI